MINDNQKENILNLMQLCVQILPNVRGGDLTWLFLHSGLVSSVILGWTTELLVPIEGNKNVGD